MQPLCHCSSCSLYIFNFSVSLFKIELYFKERRNGLRTFEEFIYSHFDTDAECYKKLKWDKSKFSRIKKGEQIPKITDINDLSKATHTPIAEVALFFLP